MEGSKGVSGVRYHDEGEVQENRTSTRPSILEPEPIVLQYQILYRCLNDYEEGSSPS